MYVQMCVGLIYYRQLRQEYATMKY
jgi:hypothetical protein